MKRVLVVDDDDALRQLVAEALREARYRVELAANGAEALRLMRRRLPHAIVLDLMMPQLDGSGFVELMRLNPRFAAVPAERRYFSTGHPLGLTWISTLCCFGGVERAA